jgi:NAD(P)-dependent dehydrogenase (short-subunit alcohol dehydrogenase family)
MTPGWKSELGLTEEQIEELKVQAAANTPLDRIGTPEKIAAQVPFLASDESSDIHQGRALCGWRRSTDLIELAVWRVINDSRRQKEERCRGIDSVA